MAKPEIVEASRKMAEQVDVPYMVQSNVSTGGAYNYAASTCDIPAVLLERGCMGTWEREEVDSMRAMCETFSAALELTTESVPTVRTIR